VLLVHSGGLSSRQWRKLEALLAPEYTVLAPDLLGYGSSGPWPTGAPFHFEMDVAKLDALTQDATHVVGHSYGGFLALKLALARPQKVASLALFEPVALGVLDAPEDQDARALLGSVKLDFDPSAPDPWLAQFVDWWNGAGAWASLAPEARAGFRAVGWKLFQEVRSLVADTTTSAAYASVTAPTLLLGGERSPLSERRVLERLAQSLPRARLQFFPEMGHMGPISRADIVNAAIAEHLRGA
jgi:pimeloyl-ACP methyl ester carboxylesterase